MSEVTKVVLEKVKRIVGTGRPIGLHEPEFSGNEWNYIKECLDTGWVSSVGKYVGRFEEVLSEFTGAKFAIATSNGTCALQLCCELAGVGEREEVLVPSLTFVGTANAVVHAGGIPHFVDSEPNALAVDARKLDDYLKEIAKVESDHCINRVTGRVIRALVVVHIFGFSADLESCEEVCRRYKLALIEDAAESLGTFYRTRHTGTVGLLGALSFNGNKIVTTGGGGAILTNDPEIGRRAKHLTTTAKRPHSWEFYHDEVGYNYRLPNLNAALGVAQMEALPRYLKQKAILAQSYAAAFEGVAGIRFIKSPNYSKSNYWLNAICLDDPSGKEELLTIANAEGILLRPIWTLMHRLSVYAANPRMETQTAEFLADRVINLPSSARLGELSG